MNTPPLARARPSTPSAPHPCFWAAIAGSGLEDNLYLGKGVRAKTNAEMVAKMRRIIEEFSLEVATPDEGREILGLK